MLGDGVGCAVLGSVAVGDGADLDRAGVGGAEVGGGSDEGCADGVGLDEDCLGPAGVDGDCVEVDRLVTGPDGLGLGRVGLSGLGLGRVGLDIGWFAGSCGGAAVSSSGEASVALPDGRVGRCVVLLLGSVLP